MSLPLQNAPSMFPCFHATMPACLGEGGKMRRIIDWQPSLDGVVGYHFQKKDKKGCQHVRR